MALQLFENAPNRSTSSAPNLRFLRQNATHPPKSCVPGITAGLLVIHRLPGHIVWHPQRYPQSSKLTQLLLKHNAGCVAIIPIRFSAVVILQ